MSQTATENQRNSKIEEAVAEEAEAIEDAIKIIFQKILNNKVLFHDQYYDTFIFYDGEAIPLQSRKFKTLLYRQRSEKAGEPFSIDKLRREILLLEAEALYKCPQKTLYTRVAEMDNSFWYDLGDGSAVKISKGKWELVGAPILFRRYKHQKKQSSPQKRGRPEDIFKHMINVPDEQKLLVLVYIISCFVPNIGPAQT